MTMRILTLLSTAVIFSSAAGGVATALEGPGRALAPSNNLKLSANTERSATQVFPLPVKEFVVPYAGKVRVRWQLRSSDGTKDAHISVSSRVQTCTAATAQTTYKGGVCDIRVAAGDLILVMVNGTADGGGSSTAFVRNVRVFYDLVDSTGLGTVQKD